MFVPASILCAKSARMYVETYICMIYSMCSALNLAITAFRGFRDQLGSAWKTMFYDFSTIFHLWVYTQVCDVNDECENNQLQYVYIVEII